MDIVRPINAYVTSAYSALAKKKSWLGSLIWGPFIKCIPFTKWFSHEKKAALSSRLKDTI